ncbi:MAG: hypothetical protein B6241_11230, partial [Spirochaetaceae bacterium 4572_59]
MFYGKEKIMEDDIIRLDTRIIYLEDSIQQMNMIMLEQDKKMDKLMVVVNALREKISELEEKKGERG